MDRSLWSHQSCMHIHPPYSCLYHAFVSSWEKTHKKNHHAYGARTQQLYIQQKTKKISPCWKLLGHVVYKPVVLINDWDYTLNNLSQTIELLEETKYFCQLQQNSDSYLILFRNYHLVAKIDAFEKAVWMAMIYLIYTGHSPALTDHVITFRTKQLTAVASTISLSFITSEGQIL